VQRLGRESPVLLEVVRAGADLAAAEIEEPEPPVDAAPHQLPVHEVVALDLARQRQAPTVVRQDLVPEVEAHHRRDVATLVGDDETVAGGAEDRLQQPEVAAGKIGVPRLRTLAE